MKNQNLEEGNCFTSKQQAYKVLNGIVNYRQISRKLPLFISNKLQQLASHKSIQHVGNIPQNKF